MTGLWYTLIEMTFLERLRQPLRGHIMVIETKLTKLVTTTKLAEGGRVVIPAEFRQALGMRIGDDLVMYLVDGKVYLLTRKQAVMEAAKQLQDLVDQHIPKEISLVDELIAERRWEAAKENSE